MQTIIHKIAAFGVAVFALLPFTTDVFGADEADRLVVVELFTSQGCSSCPPADRLLEEIRERDTALVLSWPVDYWDRLGWEDTFALPGNAVRQAAYNKRFGRGGLYTPQMVFNGTLAGVGSRRREVETAYSRSLETDESWYAPTLIRGEDRSFSLHLPEAVLEQDAVVRVVYYTEDGVVDVGDGENEGRKLHYSNVVRATDIAGEWTGSALTLTIDAEKGIEAGADHVAVLVQDGGQHGAIMGASAIAITDQPRPVFMSR